MGFGTVIRGDQLEKRFKIKIGSVEQTDEELDDVIVQWGKVQKTASAGDVTYSDGYWRFTLTEEETLAETRSSIICQIEVIFGTTKRQSVAFRDDVGMTVISRGGET